MMDNKSYVLLGSGGHAKILYEVLMLNKISVIGFVAPEKSSDTFFEDLKYLGNDFTFNINTDRIYLANTLGSVKYTQPREQLYLHYKDRQYFFPAIIHPSAIISDSAIISEGVQCLAGTIINACAIIEENTIINSGAIIEHDCHLGTHNHIAPGAVLSGNVTTGSNVHIGAGTIINQGIHIGHNSIIASGAVVIKDIADNSIVAGVPAVSIK